MSSSRFTLRLLLLVLLGCGLRLPAAAQIQYANQVIGQQGLVTNAPRAADSDLSTSANISPAVLLSVARLRVGFPATAAAGREAGLFIRPSAAVSLALLKSGAVVNTYYADGGVTTLVESYQLSSSALVLGLQPNGTTRLYFVPTQNFNQIELLYTSVLSLGEAVELYEAYSTVSPLPVALTRFEAQATPTGTVLAWATASEREAAEFVVERAAATPEDFRAIGRVPSTGTTAQAQTYQFVDAAADLAPLSYYRLRQVDRDGSSTFSPVRAVQRGAAASAGLRAYPSPTAGLLSVAGAGGTRFRLFDQLGRPLPAVALATGQSQLDVSGLPSGIYILQDEATGQRTRFVKGSDIR